jgi:hypothetical protein
MSNIDKACAQFAFSGALKVRQGLRRRAATLFHAGGHQRPVRVKAPQGKGLIQFRVPKRGVPFSRPTFIQNDSLYLIPTIHINEGHHRLLFVIGYHNDDIGSVITLERDVSDEGIIVLRTSLEYDARLAFLLDRILSNRNSKESPNVPCRNGNVASGSGVPAMVGAPMVCRGRSPTGGWSTLRSSDLFWGKDLLIQNQSAAPRCCLSGAIDWKPISIAPFDHHLELAVLR